MDEDGVKYGKPWELTKAEIIDSLCQRWGCVPSMLYEEDTMDIIQMLSILGMADEAKSGSGPGRQQRSGPSSTSNPMEQELLNFSRTMSASEE